MLQQVGCRYYCGSSSGDPASWLVVLVLKTPTLMQAMMVIRALACGDLAMGRRLGVVRRLSVMRNAMSLPPLWERRNRARRLVVVWDDVSRNHPYIGRIAQTAVDYKFAGRTVDGSKMAV